MTFTLNDDQRMLKDTARDFFREQAPVTRLRKQRDELVEIYPNEIDRTDVVKGRLRDIDRRIKGLESEQSAGGGGLPPSGLPSTLAPLPPAP